MDSSRKIVFDILKKIEYEAAYSNIVLNNALNSEALNKRDKGFVSAVFYGVLERKITIDYIIAAHSKTPVRKLDDDVLIILRMGVYQIVFMDKVPDSAAVNESVELAAKCGKKSASSFINAVLRAVSNENIDTSFENIKKDTFLYLSIKYSCPISVIKHLFRSYGEENTVNFLKCINGRPPLSLRVNTLKCTKDKLKKELSLFGVECENSDFLENAMNIKNTTSIEALPPFKKGYFHIQDIASQICCDILGAKSGQTVADVCAAPGGKSLTIAENMGGNGTVYAYDLYEHKLNLLNESAARLGINIIKTAVRDAQNGKNDISADCVLCDVPCSGLGIIRRKPEIRYKKNLGINELPPVQYEILNNSAQLVKKGGILLYSTCTLNQKENRENADKFLSVHGDFKAKEIVLPNKIKRTIEEPSNQLTLFPQTNNTDGFFISVFERIR